MQIKIANNSREKRELQQRKQSQWAIKLNSEQYLHSNNVYIIWKESYDQPIQHVKKQRHYFARKGPSSQGYGFSSGHVWM